MGGLSETQLQKASENIETRHALTPDPICSDKSCQTTPRGTGMKYVYGVELITQIHGYKNAKNFHMQRLVSACGHMVTFLLVYILGLYRVKEEDEFSRQKGHYFHNVPNDLSEEPV